MEQRPAQTVARDHLLQITQARLYLQPSVSPVTLEDRCVRMIEPSDTQKQQEQQQQQQQDTEKEDTKQAPVALSSSPKPIVVLHTSPATAPKSAERKISGDETTSSRPFVATSPPLCTQLPTTPTFKRAERSTVKLETSGVSETASLSPPSPTLISPVLKTSSVSSPLSLSPPSPSLSSASSGGFREDESTEFVEGKRPLNEDKLTLVVPGLNHGDEVSPAGRSPGTGSDSSASSWSQPYSQRSRSATTTSKLSTREQLLPGDQPFRDKSSSEGKLSFQFSLSAPKRDRAHVMEFFQEQEKNLQERFLSLPKNPPRKQRSPSPNVQQKLGLEHLDNLVKLMQQLTSLKDENSRLRKRCDYLESTKSLLQAKKDINAEGSQLLLPSTFTPTSAAVKQKHRHHYHYHHQKDQSQPPLTASYTLPGQGVRSRLSSAEDFDFLESIESSSDQQPKHAKKLHKRSFSTGSIEIDLLDSEVTDISSDDKAPKYKLIGKSSSKQKGKSSKWARVKKVLTGQKLYEDLNTTIKSLREFGKTSHIRYSSSGTHEKGGGISPRSSGSRAYRRSDSIPVSGYDRDSQPTYSGYQVMDTTEALDLTTDIWMGPPGWEEYETNKESATSASSDVSSVIEVTTIYLGQNKPDSMSTSQTTSTSTSSSSSFTTTTTTSIKNTKRSPTQESLSVESDLRRRKSSPALSMNDDDEEDDKSLLELASRTEPMRFLHKSSSCKSAELDLPKSTLDTKDSIKKFHRTAWGRVKDIIHTRKGSIKRKPRKDKSGMFLTEPEESSEVDMEALLDEGWHADLFAEGLLSRSTPKSSPMVIRQTQGANKASESSSSEALGLSKSMGATSSSPSHGAVDMAALLGRSMSDDFNKKMQEWEEMKSRKASVKHSVDESELCSLEESVTSQDVRTVDLKDFRGAIPEVASESLVTDDSNTSTEVIGLPSVHTEDMAKKKMSESFCRKMQEWERLKYKGSPGPFREPSPEMERKGSKGRKEDRQKSKRSREEKEKEKLERQREREMQKVEKEQVKLEKEKLRIEKERLRALEREAKLEKLKGRLNQADTENMAKNPVLSPLAEYKVTSDFAHKLHEWELRKGLSHAVSNSVYLEAHKIKSQLKEGLPSETSPRQDSVRFTFDTVDEAQDGDSATIQPYWDSPDDTSPIEKYSETSLDETSLTAETRTASNIPTLERANAQLLQELHKKEMEYQAVQEDVQSLNEKLANVKEEHTAEIARFHQQLKEGNVTAPVKLEIGELERTIGDVEEKIQMMENFGESLAKSMESAAVGKWQSIEGEESVHMQLVELVAQMRGMLIQATQSEEASQKTSALTNFEVLYSQAMKLQVEMNNLRLSHLERNREIMVIKRQLLLQEVNNLVLQADITRREAELYQFHQAKQFSSLRRWNTFSGYRTDRHRPQAQIELPSSIAKAKPDGGMTKSFSDRDSKMQRFHEQGIPITALSAPCSPLAQTTVEEELPFLQLEAVVGQADPNVSESTEEQLDSPEQPYQSSTNGEGKLATDIKETSSDTPIGQRTAEKLTREILRMPVLDPMSIQQLPQDEILQPTKRGVETVTQQDNVNKETTDVTIPLEISTLTDYRTQFDSVPLQQEIEALRREKTKVANGSTTLSTRFTGLESSPGPSTGQSPRDSTGKPETLTQTIPKQPSLEVKPRLHKAAQIIDYDFPTAQSVMECTETSPTTTTDHNLPSNTLAQGLENGVTLSMASPPSPNNLSALPPIADQSRGGPRSPRSPVSKHKLLRRQKEKEEREAKSKDYSAISPKGSPVAARGKPPLPRQDRVIRHSPSSSPSISDKGSRSKSHEDVDGAPRSPSMGKPLQDTMNKFEKRATICETEDRPVELRKTPSPTLHLPRVGLVNRVRKLKPAAELLEESQRYRSGQSIYATRIMQKYLPKDETKSDSQATKHNKENLSGSYVHAMVQRLSRESTPARSGGSSRTTSNSSLHKTDAPRSQSEFVSHIVRKLSSSSGPDITSSTSPLSDLTNEGHVKELTSAFACKTESGQSLDHSDIVKPRASSSPQHSHYRRSCEVAMVLSSKDPSISETYTLVSAVSTGSVALSHETSSTTVTSAIPTSHKSLPSFSSPKPSPSHDPHARSKSAGQKPGVSFEVEPDFSSITSTSSVFRSPSDEESEEVTKRSKEKRKKGDSRRLLASLSPVRKGAGRGRMETVGVLCKQSVSFDLGVSMYAKEEPPPASKKKLAQVKTRKPRSWDPSDSAAAEAEAVAECSAPPASASTSAIEDVMTSSAEGEIAPSSPTTTEKKRSKRFLDSSWLQKSKRFFKVSK